MGLLLSVLVTCVGFIEFFAFFSKVQRYLDRPRITHRDLNEFTENIMRDLRKERYRVLTRRWKALEVEEVDFREETLDNLAKFDVKIDYTGDNDESRLDFVRCPSPYPTFEKIVPKNSSAPFNNPRINIEEIDEEVSYKSNSSISSSLLDLNDGFRFGTHKKEIASEIEKSGSVCFETSSCKRFPDINYLTTEILQPHVKGTDEIFTPGLRKCRSHSDFNEYCQDLRKSYLKLSQCKKDYDSNSESEIAEEYLKDVVSPSRISKRHSKSCNDLVSLDFWRRSRSPFEEFLSEDVNARFQKSNESLNEFENIQEIEGNYFDVTLNQCLQNQIVDKKYWRRSPSPFEQLIQCEDEFARNKNKFTVNFVQIEYTNTPFRINSDKTGCLSNEVFEDCDLFQMKYLSDEDRKKVTLVKNLNKEFNSGNMSKKYVEGLEKSDKSIFIEKLVKDSTSVKQMKENSEILKTVAADLSSEINKNNFIFACHEIEENNLISSEENNLILPNVTEENNFIPSEKIKENNLIPPESFEENNIEVRKFKDNMVISDREQYCELNTGSHFSSENLNSFEGESLGEDSRSPKLSVLEVKVENSAFPLLIKNEEFQNSESLCEQREALETLSQQKELESSNLQREFEEDVHKFNINKKEEKFHNQEKIEAISQIDEEDKIETDPSERERTDDKINLVKQNELNCKEKESKKSEPFWVRKIFFFFDVFFL